MNRILSLIGVVLVVGCGSPPPDGPYEGYYDNGQLWERVTYEDGERDGLYEGYYNNGLLGSKVTYKNGKWDGPYESYHEDGQLLSKGTYKDWEKCGEWFEEGETVTYDPCPPGLEDGN